MNTYLIRIDNKYFVEINEEEIKVPAGGWYDKGGTTGCVILTNKLSEAKRIEGNINLKSYFNKIYEAIRYGDFEFNKLEIVRVENDR
mgnify:CR=1 FL=1